MQKTISDEPRKHFVFLASVFAMGLLGLALLWSQGWLHDQARAQAGAAISTILGTTRQGILSWSEEHLEGAMIWANEPEVVALTRELLQTPITQADLGANPAQEKLRRLLDPILTARKYQGFFLINDKNINIASTHNENLARPSLLLSQPAFFNKIRQAKAALSLVQPSEVPLPDSRGHLTQGAPTMFVGAPVFGEGGDILAIFTFRIDPSQDFTSLLEMGRIGNTGETYAFDQKGLLISQSRFEKELTDAGMLPPGRHSILNLQTRNPGVNLLKEKPSQVTARDWDLTTMASSATRGESGLNLEGYRNYLGDQVIGAWLWDKELGFGLCTEISAEEVYLLYRVGFKINMLLTVFAMTLIGLLALLFIWSKQRIIESEKRFHYALQGTNDGLWDWDLETGSVFFSSRWKQMLGFDEQEVAPALSAWRELLHPEDLPRAIDHVREYLRGKVPNLEIEYRMRHKNGRYRYILSRAIAVTNPKTGRVKRLVGTHLDLTERKETEALIRENKALLLATFDSTTEGILVLDEDGTILTANRRFMEIWGLPKNFVLQGRTWPLVEIAPNLLEDPEGFKSLVVQTLTQRPPRTDELRFLDGRILERFSGPLELENRHGMVVNFRDVTNQRRTEEALRAVLRGTGSATGVEFFRQLVRHLAQALKFRHILIGELVEQEKIRTLAVWEGEDFGGDVFYDLKGTPCAQVLGQGMCVFSQNIADMFPEDQRIKRLGIQSYLGTPLQDTEGKTLGLLVALHDQPIKNVQFAKDLLNIFASRAAAELAKMQAFSALRNALFDAENARRQIQGILASVPDALIVTDAQSHVLLMNHAGEQLLGCTLNGAQGKDISEVLRSDLPKECFLHMFQNPREMPTRDLYLSPSHPEEAKVFQARVSPIPGHTQNLSGVVALLRDVTEERKLDRLKSEFISTAAHELRTPLTSVLGYSEMLRDNEGFSQEDRRAFLDTICDKADDLAKIIDDLLDLSHVESGQLIRLERQTDILPEVIESVVRFYRTHHPDREFTLQLPVFVPPMQFDRRKLAQVLDNLMSNAVKYSPGGSAVNLRGQQKKDYFQVDVSDHGMGMTPEQTVKVFDKFYRADSSTTAVGGLGLGMAIAKAIVTSHGGEIWIQSQPGEGTTVSFTLPLRPLVI